jgi:hypothetical protein
MSFIAVSLWGAFMMAAIFYTQEARHPETRALVAYLIFVTVFTVTAFVAFSTLTLLLQAAGLAHSLEHPAAAIGFLAAVFLPAFFLARWQLRKPPRRPAFPDQSGVRKQS